MMADMETMAMVKVADMIVTETGKEKMIGTIGMIAIVKAGETIEGERSKLGNENALVIQGIFIFWGI